jgi:hypothetical protein
MTSLANTSWGAQAWCADMNLLSMQGSHLSIQEVKADGVPGLSTVIQQT